MYKCTICLGSKYDALSFSWSVFVLNNDAVLKNVLSQDLPTVSALSFSESIKIVGSKAEVPPGSAAAVVSDKCTVYILLKVGYIFMYMLRLACTICAARIYAYQFVCILMFFKGRNHVQTQNKCKILMLFPRHYALSNGALNFPVSSVLYAENAGWMEGTVSLNSYVHFILHNIEVTAKTSARLERTWNFDLETALTFSSYLYALSVLEEQGIHTMHICP
jgi:hypothetical protein